MSKEHNYIAVYVVDIRITEDEDSDAEDMKRTATIRAQELAGKLKSHGLRLNQVIDNKLKLI